MRYSPYPHRATSPVQGEEQKHKYIIMQGSPSWGSRYMQRTGDPGKNSLTLNLGWSSSLCLEALLPL